MSSDVRATVRSRWRFRKSSRGRPRKPFMEKPEENTDRRQSGDRRGQRRPRLKFFLLGGRRKSARRGGDKKEFIYVDQYQPWLLVIIVLVLVLSISDGLFTLHLINLGAVEKNPLMAYLSMIGLIVPPVIAVMEPLRSAPKATSDGSSNYGFSPPFGVVFSAR